MRLKQKSISDGVHPLSTYCSCNKEINRAASLTNANLLDGDKKKQSALPGKDRTV